MEEPNENKNKILKRMRQKLTERQKKIMEEMKKNPKITYWDLQFVIGISDRSICKHVRKLKAIGLVKRVGPNYQGGHWEVLDDSCI